MTATTRVHPTILRGPEARASLTRTFGDNVVPESVLERNQKLYGERLTPQQVVDTILRDVRLEGDAAVERYSSLLDGLPGFGMEVPYERLVQARDSLEPALLTAIRTAISRLRHCRCSHPGLRRAVFIAPSAPVAAPAAALGTGLIRSGLIWSGLIWSGLIRSGFGRGFGLHRLRSNLLRSCLATFGPVASPLLHSRSRPLIAGHLCSSLLRPRLLHAFPSTFDL